MNHSFDIENAKKYGVEIAIIIENLFFWINKNRANNKNFFNGTLSEARRQIILK